MSSEQQRRQEGQAFYAAARTRLFNMKAKDIGVAAPPDGPQVWGVVIDYPASRMTCTLAILADGTVDFLLSEGPAFVGAGQHRDVALAAENVLSAAQSLHSSLQPTTVFSPPDNDCARVYLLTTKGVLAEEVLHNGSSERQHRLAEICRQGDAVITAIRKQYASEQARTKQYDDPFNPQDNRFQAKIVAGSFALGAGAGTIAALRGGLPFWAGALMGGLAGLILGVFGSGLLLMLMRAKRRQ